MNWIYTTNHKRIAINYFFFIIFSGSCGLVLATLIRMELAYPGVSIFMGDGIKYLTISTLHGIIMVFFMIIPLIFGAYGNYLLPLQLGVHDVAFPRMNSAAFWFLPAGLIMLCQLLSLDKRYHTVNCFSFAKADSYINFNKLQSIYTTTQPLHLNLSQNYKYNYCFANTYISYNSSFFLSYKYNIFKKNYNIYYNFYTYCALFYSDIKKLICKFFYLVKNINLFKTRINFNWYDMVYSWNYINIVYNQNYNFKNWSLFYLKELIKKNTIADYLPKNAYLHYYLYNKYEFNITKQNQSNYFNRPYNVVQFIPDVKLIPQEYYDTQFILKQRHPLYINTKFININMTDAIFNEQLTQNIYNMYTKYYININKGNHSMFFINNKNILLWSSYLKFFLQTLKFDVFVDISVEYIYRHNVKDHSNVIFNIFDKNIIYNSHLFNQPNWLNAVTNLHNFNKIFYNQRHQAFIFKSTIVNVNNYQQAFANWKNLRFQREFWRCRSLISKNLLHNYKYHADWSFLFDLSNKYSIISDSADVLPGWAFVTPFSARTKYTKSGKTDVALFAIAISSFGSFIGSLNFLITYRYLSTLNNKKMRDARCFFAEGLLIGSGMMVVANPVLFIAIFLLLSDRQWHTSFFDYSNGGDTVLFQHLFWFFGHPEVYIIIIPCFGLINTILSYYLRKRLSARASLLYSMYTIAFLSFFVWGHHMYMVGLSHHTRMLYSTITVMISVPAATKIMHWLVTIVNSSIHYELPLIFVIIFIFLFVSGGISGMAVAHTGMDILFHDTFYVIGHFHVLFAGAAMFATFGAFYFYFPFIWGVKYSRIFAYFHLFYYLIGQLMTVIPMLWLGYAGMPRRILDYPAVFGGWHSVISSGHLISTAGIAAFFLMLFLSLKQQHLAINTTLGVGRYNTRLNFYIYEASKLFLIRRKYKIFLQK